MEKSEVFFTDMRARPRKNLPAKLESLLLRAGFAEMDLARKLPTNLL